MPPPITREQALSFLPPVFHDQFRQLLATHVQASEIIYFAAPCSSDISFGFAVLTDYRVLGVLYRDQRQWSVGPRPHVRYYKEGGGFFSQTVADERYWFPPTETPLNSRELDGRNVLDVLYTTVRAVHRKDYTVFYQDRDTEIAELTIETGERFGSRRPPLALERSTGASIYSLIQSAIQDGGRLASSSTDAEAALAQLERLAALHRSGALTDQEFRAAKAKLLGL